MFRFRFLRPNLIQPFLRTRPVRPKAKLFTRTGALTTAAVTLGALVLRTSSDDPTQIQTELRDSDPDQTPLSSLIRAYFVFSLCSLPSLVDASPAILSSLSSIPILRDISEALLKVTFFDQFVGAETVDGCIPVLHRLRRLNQGVLFSYSVEQPHQDPKNEQTLDTSRLALESILRSIDVGADFEERLSPSSAYQTGKGSWVAIKLSTLVPKPESEGDPTQDALWALSEWIVQRQASRQSANSRINDKDPMVPFPGVPNAQDFQLFLNPVHHRKIDVARHIKTLVTLHTDLRKICTRAQERGVRLTIDAEETWLQPAIDLYSILLMKEFNSLPPREGGSKRPMTQPLLYTTLQAYLVRAPIFLDFLIAHARENEYSLGVKLVRGAYIDAEVAAHAYAKAHGSSEVVKAHKGVESISPDENPPTYGCKQATDAAYDACVRVLVGEVAKELGQLELQAQGTQRKEMVPRIAVLFGTHNWRSSKLVLDEILRLGMGREVESWGGEGDRSDGTSMTEKRTRKDVGKIVLSEEVRKRVCMSQLYGMQDSLAAYLVDRTTSSFEAHPSNPFVIRYLPYGPLRDVMPYLARRAVENRNVLGSSGRIEECDVDAENERGDRGGAGGAVEERRRFGRLIWERVVGFWRF